MTPKEIVKRLRKIARPLIALDAKLADLNVASLPEDKKHRVFIEIIFGLTDAECEIDFLFDDMKDNDDGFDGVASLAKRMHAIGGRNESLDTILRKAPKWVNSIKIAVMELQTKLYRIMRGRQRTP